MAGIYRAKPARVIINSAVNYGAAPGRGRSPTATPLDKETLKSTRVNRRVLHINMFPNEVYTCIRFTSETMIA